MLHAIGVPGQNKHVHCASCSHGWDVNYLVNDLGRHRLRAEGFAYILFDDGAIMVNYCPSCDVPSIARVCAPAEVVQAAA